MRPPLGIAPVELCGQLLDARLGSRVAVFVAQTGPVWVRLIPFAGVAVVVGLQVLSALWARAHPVVLILWLGLAWHAALVVPVVD